MSHPPISRTSPTTPSSSIDAHIIEPGLSDVLMLPPACLFNREAYEYNRRRDLPQHTRFLVIPCLPQQREGIIITHWFLPIIQGRQSIREAICQTMAFLPPQPPGHTMLTAQMLMLCMANCPTQVPQSPHMPFPDTQHWSGWPWESCVCVKG